MPQGHAKLTAQIICSQLAASVSKSTRSVTNAYAALLFGRGSAIGWLLLGASCFDVNSGVSGFFALLGAGAVVRLLGYRRDLADQGFFGTSALLCGLAMGHGHALSAVLVCVVLVAGAIAALLTAALSELCNRVFYLPILVLPFLITTTLLQPVTSALCLAPGRMGIPAIPDLPAQLPALLAFVVKSFGAIIFQPTTSAGLLVLIASLLYSRIATGYGAWGVYVASLVVHYLSPQAEPMIVQAAGYNGLLASIALGATFFVPSLGSLLWATLGSLAASGLALSLGRQNPQMESAILAWPFVIVSLTLLRALGLRSPHRAPAPPALPFSSAEDNLRYARMLKCRFGLPGPARIASPVLGVWTITQGFDGAHTHQGALRHALDLEITDNDGFPFGIRVTIAKTTIASILRCMQSYRGLWLLRTRTTKITLPARRIWRFLGAMWWSSNMGRHSFP